MLPRPIPCLAHGRTSPPVQPFAVMSNPARIPVQRTGSVFLDVGRHAASERLARQNDRLPCGLERRPSPVPEIQALRKTLTVEPAQAIADHEPRIFKAARHAMKAARRATDEHVRAWLYHAIDLASPPFRPRLKSLEAVARLVVRDGTR